MGTNLRQNPDGSVSLVSDADAIEHMRAGGPITPTVALPRWSNEKTAKVPLAAGAGAAGVLSWVNPEVGAIIVTNLLLDVTTKSTGASTVSFGQAATSVASQNLIDTLDVGTAIGTFDNNTDKGALGKTRQKVAAGQFVTGSQQTGAVAGLVGFAYITYIPV